MVSWFAGFAPVDSPKIAVAVLLSNDVSWWSKGNQVARRVFEAYFEKP
jgi:cell division protein FtsI/penicillin-binding protein 2